MELIKGFSIVDNYQKLMNFTRENEDLGIHLMKVLAMLFVIYGHRFMFSMSFPMFDTERIEIVSYEDDEHQTIIFDND